MSHAILSLSLNVKVYLQPQPPQPPPSIPPPFLQKQQIRISATGRQQQLLKNPLRHPLLQRQMISKIIKIQRQQLPPNKSKPFIKLPPKVNISLRLCRKFFVSAKFFYYQYKLRNQKMLQFRSYLIAIGKFLC